MFAHGMIFYRGKAPNKNYPFAWGLESTMQEVKNSMHRLFAVTPGGNKVLFFENCSR
jgi:hypothetical protein